VLGETLLHAEGAADWLLCFQHDGLLAQRRIE